MSDNKKMLIYAAGVLLGGLGLLALMQLLPALMFIFLMAGSSEDELLLTAASPQGTHTLEVHRLNPGATEPFSIRVFRVEEGRQKRIYMVRGQEEAEIVWLSENVAAIGGLVLDLAQGETFEAYENQYFCVRLQVDAPDVQAVTIRLTSSGAKWISRAERAEGALELTEVYWRDDLAENPIRMTVTAETADGVRVTLPLCWIWTARPFGGAYGFTLTGSAEGYTLTPDWIACQTVPAEDAP